MADITITDTHFEDATITDFPNNVSLTSAVPEALKVPEGCVASITEVSPALAKFDDISEESVKAIEHTVYLGVMPTLVIVGLGANSLNIVVFYRMGVKKGINLCLLLLSVSDVLFLLTQTAIRLSRSLLALAQSARGLSRWDYTMATYHLIRKATIFLFFSNFLTTLASLERCVSIVSPLKARIIFSFKTVVALVIAAFIVSVSCHVAIGFQFTTVCVYDTRKNITLWGLTGTSVYFQHKRLFNTLNNLMLVFGFPVLSIAVVTISSAVVISQLKKASRWRQQTTSAGSASTGNAWTGNTSTGSASTASALIGNASTANVSNGGSSTGSVSKVNKSEVQLHKMLVMVSCIHVACTLPSIGKNVANYFVDAFNTGGADSNLFNALTAIKDAMASINCTVNFFVYYSLGSYFRQTLHQLLRRICPAASQAKKNEETVFTTTLENSIMNENDGK